MSKVEGPQRETYTLPEVHGQLRYLNTQLQEILIEAEAIANLHPRTTTPATKAITEEPHPQPNPPLMKNIDTQLQEAHNTAEQTFTLLTNINKWLQPNTDTTTN